ncbi:MAG: hypothetical protein PHQ75_00740 [Thermoguttaceae bacterium]|nr:hypothetical protein [Thermoguttaceae bacterium]
MATQVMYGRIFILNKGRVFALFLAVITCLCAHSLLAQPAKQDGASRQVASADKLIQVEANLVPAEPVISDEPVLTLTIRHPAEYSVTTPQLGERYGDFLVLDQSKAPDTVEKGIETSVASYRLRPIKSGQAVLAPLAVTLTPVSKADAPKAAVALTVPPGTVRILSQYENKDVSAADLSASSSSIGSRIGLWCALAAMVLLAGLVLLLVFYRRKRSVQAAAVEPTPFEVAKGRLNELMNDRLYEKDVKEFYSRITGIVRWYIEKVTGVQAPDRTTEEFLHEITTDIQQRKTFGDELRARLRHFLEFADLVKFAKFQPTLDDIFDGYRSANSVVEYQFNRNDELPGLPSPRLNEKESEQ